MRTFEKYLLSLLPAAGPDTVDCRLFLCVYIRVAGSRKDIAPWPQLRSFYFWYFRRFVPAPVGL